MTVQEFQARRVERIAAALAHFVRTTPADKLGWRPRLVGEGRSVLEQAAECVLVNRALAAILRGEETGHPLAGRSGPLLEFQSAEDACAQLESSAAEVAAAILALDDGAMERAFPHWRGPMTGESLLEMPYRNMAYHAGQVNLIQLLLGDSEFHLPPTWL